MTGAGHESFPPRGEIKAASPVVGYFCAIDLPRLFPPTRRARSFFCEPSIFDPASAKLSRRLTQPRKVLSRNRARLKIIQFDEDQTLRSDSYDNFLDVSLRLIRF